MPDLFPVVSYRIKDKIVVKSIIIPSKIQARLPKDAHLAGDRHKISPDGSIKMFLQLAGRRFFKIKKAPDGSAGAFYKV
jgi:hypothetical protein